MWSSPLTTSVFFHMAEPYQIHHLEESLSLPQQSEVVATDFKRFLPYNEAVPNSPS
ncbi:MAG: hypothetical protein RSC41_04730 [Oscillospiraceae bacterium]